MSCFLNLYLSLFVQAWRPSFFFFSFFILNVTQSKNSTRKFNNNGIDNAKICIERYASISFIYQKSESFRKKLSTLVATINFSFQRWTARQIEKIEINGASFLPHFYRIRWNDDLWTTRRNRSPREWQITRRILSKMKLFCFSNLLSCKFCRKYRAKLSIHLFLL